MIPVELTELRQWVVAGADKIPVDAKTGRPASVTDPLTWSSYEEAFAAWSRYPHIQHAGFVLTDNDPYAFIDLDEPQNAEQLERHKKVYELFPSYAELSQSGKGIHIIVRGRVPHGAKRDRVELYSSARYMIMTGSTLRDIPIVDCQELLTTLFWEMNVDAIGYAELHEADALLDDKGLVEMASRAVNGDKFDALCNGEWPSLGYPSQSEADFALISIFAFYSPNNDQVMRLFRSSKLGQREKAWRDDYLLRCLRKIRSNEPERIDFGQLESPQQNGNGHYPGTVPPLPPKTLENHDRPGIRAQPAQDRTVGANAVHSGYSANGVRHVRNDADVLPFPPGLVGDVARYIYGSAFRPVPEVAIVASLALCAGLAGRQFNISGTGLNQYIILLAKTGAGKEGGTAGIDRIVSAVRNIVPLIDDFIGPATFASGQSIVKTLDKTPCFVSIVGEFGLNLQTYSDANADSLSRHMRRTLLDVHSKSGRGSVMRPLAYSDREKNTQTVISPAMTLLGESTPDTFYAGLSLSMIADGLIPRFLLVEYLGDRPPRNVDAFYPPDEKLVGRMVDLASTVLQMQANQAWQEVQLSAEAKSLLDDFDQECDDHIIGGSNDGVRQLWNRAHLNALRVCGLLAASDRPHECLVRADEASWAIGLVRRSLATLLARFESGDVGEGDSKQNADLKRILGDYFDSTPKELRAYGVDPHMQGKRVVPYVYLQRRTVNLSAFRKHPQGARNALRQALDDLVRTGELVEVNKQQMKQDFGTGASGYFVPVIRVNEGI